MLNLADEELRDLEALCRRFGVRRLELFGSATGPRFDPERSDLDFLVDLEPSPGLEYADAYFGFKDAVEARFGHPVQLVSRRSLRNPFFLESIARNRRLLYAA